MDFVISQIDDSADGRVLWLEVEDIVSLIINVHTIYGVYGGGVFKICMYIFISVPIAMSHLL